MITDDQVVELFERADPARDADATSLPDAAQFLDDLRASSTALRVIDINRPPSRYAGRGWWIIAAAAVVVLIGGGALVLARRRGDHLRPTTPVVPVNPATLGDPQAETIAADFVGTLYSSEADASALSPEALASGWGNAERFRLEGEFFEATLSKMTVTGCATEDISAAGSVVRCDYEIHQFGSDELGHGPYRGNAWTVTVRDGAIVRAEQTEAYMTNGFSGEMWEPFARWVLAEHPDDVPKLYENAAQTSWLISEESIPLWSQRLREYIDESKGLGATARGFLDAFDSGDADRAIGYLSADSDVALLIGSIAGTESAQGSPDDLRVAIALLQAQGYRQTVDACGDKGFLSTGFLLRCTVSFSRLGSDRLGLGPFAGASIDLVVRDGKITSAYQYGGQEAFTAEVWTPFAAWIAETHPEDVAVMYTDAEQTKSRLSEESVQRWAQRVEEYVTTAG